MRKVGAMHRSKVIGLLGERLAFERAAVKLLRRRAGEAAGAGRGRTRRWQAHLAPQSREEEKETRGVAGGTACACWAARPGPKGNACLEVRREARRREDVLLGDPEARAALPTAPGRRKCRTWADGKLLLEVADSRPRTTRAPRMPFSSGSTKEQEHFPFSLCHTSAAVFAGSEILDETVTTLEDASA